MRKLLGSPICFLGVAWTLLLHFGGGSAAAQPCTWNAVAPGRFHTIGISSEGTLWGWGNNGNGELGLGTTEDQNLPTGAFRQPRQVCRLHTTC